MLVAASATAVCLLALAAHRYVHVPPWYDWNPASPSPNETMRAIIYSRHGNASELHLDMHHARPIVRKNDVLIRIRASSINPCDFKFRRNPRLKFMIPLPKIPGEDVAGDVVQLGSNAGDRFQVGDRVAAMLPPLGSPRGAAADYVAVDSSLVARIGPDLDYADAAAMPLVSLTAVQALENIKNSKGKKILIHAGAGGVGSFVIQYAKHVLGMYVATTASAAKRQFLEKLGADLVIDYHTTKFEEVIRDYDVVFDTMSWAYEGCTLKRGATVLKPDGHYLNIMSSDWTFDGREKTNGIWNALYHTLLNMFALGRFPKYHVVVVKPRGGQLKNIFDLVEKQKILPVVDRQYDLTDARSAYEYLEEGHATGKVILLNDPK